MRNILITLFAFCITANAQESVVDSLEIQNLDINNSYVKTKNEIIEFKLLVAADGRFSKTRYHANIKYFFHDYKQEAFVFNISSNAK